jgi:hypothetical protein
MKIPFNVYDFFGYLAAGFTLLVFVDASLADPALWDLDLTLSRGITLTVAAYVTGHLVAHLSSTLLQDFFVRRVLGSPAAVLLGARSSGWRHLFPGYFAPLPPEVVARLGSPGWTVGAAEAAYTRAFVSISMDADLREFLRTFLNLYGFARNMSLTFLIGAVLLAVASFAPGRTIPIWMPAAAAGVSVGMFYRYLKFYRYHAWTLLLLYAEDGVQPGAARLEHLPGS